MNVQICFQVFQANPMSFSGPSQATATSNDCSHVPSNPIADKISSDPPGGRHAPAAEPVPKSGKTPQLGNFGQPTKVDEPLTFKGRHEESSTVASEVPADGRDDPYAQSIAEEVGVFHDFSDFMITYRATEATVDRTNCRRSWKNYD